MKISDAYLRSAIMEKRMNRIFRFGVVLALALPSVEVSAEYLVPDYEVVLKKGTAFHVADFKVEGTSIRLFFNGESRRIPRAAVGRILPVFRGGRGIVAKTRSISFPKEPALAESWLSVETKGLESDRFLRDEVRLTLEAKGAAIEEFKESIRAGNKKEGARIREGILELQDRLAVLRDEARKANGGALPSWWEDVSRGPFPGGG